MPNNVNKLKQQSFQGLPWCPVVKTPCFHCRGAWVQSLVRELRSCMPCGMVKRKIAKSSRRK